MSFDKECYKLLMKVPRGKVTTYKSIALKLNTKSYRNVGSAMKRNLSLIKIPCHRVINSNGELGGYSQGLKKKIQLLKKEGVKVIDKKVDLKKFGYFFK